MYRFAVALLKPFPISMRRLRSLVDAVPALPGVGATAATKTESAVFSWSSAWNCCVKAAP
jgi:hypothetical protein